MGRKWFIQPKGWEAGEGFLELERAFREMTRKEEDAMMKRATREALDKLWRKKGVMLSGVKRSVRPDKRRKVRYE